MNPLTSVRGADRTIFSAARLFLHHPGTVHENVRDGVATAVSAVGLFLHAAAMANAMQNQAMSQPLCQRQGFSYHPGGTWCHQRSQVATAVSAVGLFLLRTFPEHSLRQRLVATAVSAAGLFLQTTQ